MIRTGVSSLVLLFGCNGTYCQSTPKPEFEVASIKPSPPLEPGHGYTAGCRGGPGTNDPGLYTCVNMSLVNMVSTAYRIDFYQLSAPNWAMATRFDLRATVPKGTTKEQFPMMLQNLLADRFKLVIRHESREIQRYQLVLAKGGPKFKEAAPPAQKSDDAPAAPGPPTLNKDGYPVIGPRGGMAFTGTGTSAGFTKASMHWPEMTMEMLASRLSGQLRGPVTDATGLTGKYDISLYWSLDNGVPAAPGADPAALPSEPSGPTLQQALQDQLGLRLESKKGPVDFLVVDRAEKSPTEN